MRNPLISVVLCGALCGPSAAWGETPPDVFENYSKRDLYDAGQRYKRKWRDGQDDLAICDLRLKAADRKLATRTSTAVRSMVVPPPEKPTGASTELVVIVGALALGLGVILGVLVEKSDTPSVVVAK